jgi:hypothetical protein
MHAGSRSHRLSLEGCLRNSQNETAAARKNSETKNPVNEDEVSKHKKKKGVPTY